MYEIYQELLDKKGLKNSDVSRATGISNMTLSDWKRGKTKPKTENIRKLADFLGVSVDYLTTGKEPEYSIEMAKIDVELSRMNDRLKEYALKLANLPKDKQEHVMQLIDFLQ
jgi:transcriptional regulator with XRE-family HTH domain